MSEKETPDMQAMEKTSVLRREVRLDLIFKCLISHWRTYIIPLVVTFALTLILVLPIPRYYTVTVMLAPEASSSGGVSGGLGSLASMAGINLSGMASGDAIIPKFYPDLMESTDFLVPILSVKVKTSNGKFCGAYGEYLTTQCKAAWWQNILGTTMNFLKGENGSNYKMSGKEKVDPYKLTKGQEGVLKKVKGSISCIVDKKTDVITIKTTSQDPLVSTMLADTVLQKLQDFITTYRTKKAKNDLKHYQELLVQASKNYAKMREEYGAYVDANQDVVLASYKVKEEKLENELQIAYNAYSQYKAQVQLAEAKVMERTPVFTTIQNPSVPIRPSGPKRMIITGLMLVLCFIGVSVYVLAKDKTLKF